jgi:hypothetical protein
MFILYLDQFEYPNINSKKYFEGKEHKKEKGLKKHWSLKRF